MPNIIHTKGTTNCKMQRICLRKKVLPYSQKTTVTRHSQGNTPGGCHGARSELISIREAELGDRHIAVHLGRNKRSGEKKFFFFNISLWLQTLNKSQHSKLTLEKKILPPHQPGFELATSQSQVWCSYQQAIPALIQCPTHPCVTTLACKRPWSFCHKCRWQVTPNHAYNLYPTKLEWVDFATVQV